MENKGTGIVKTVIYSVLVILCAVIFIAFERHANEPDSTADPDEDDIISPQPKTPQLTFLQLTPSLPYRLDIMLELLKWNIGCEVLEPVESGSTTKYELSFEQHTDTGSITFTVDDYGLVTGCTIQRRYLYNGEPVVTGVVGDTLRAEYARRLAADKKLLNAFLRTVLPRLDYLNQLSDKKIESLIKDVLSAYENREPLETVESPLRVKAESSRDEPYYEFTLTITIN